jgi:hypothetical protein
MARFFRRGKSAIKFLPAVAGTSPTRPEIVAGVDLTGSINEISGFALANAPITTPDLATTFDSQIDGPDAAEDSALVIYDDDASATIRTALAKGTNGFIILFPYLDAVGKRLEKWPVRSTGVNDQWTLDAAAATFRVQFAVTSVPVQNGVTPA